MPSASFSTFEANSRKFGIISVIAVLFSTLFIAYAVISQGQSTVIWGLGGVLLFLLCFFSVRLSLFVLIFSMLLSPQMVLGTTAAQQEHDLVIRADDIILMIMTIAWLFRVAIIKDIGVVRKNPLNRPIVVFCTCITLSTIYGAFCGNLKLAAGMFFVLKMIEYFVLFYVIVNYLNGKKELNQFLSAMLIVTGILCLWGLYQAASGSSIAAPGNPGERNTFGGYFVLMGAVAAGIFLNTESAKEKALLGVLLAFVFIVILFSISRSSWMSSFVVMFVLYLKSRKHGFFFAILILILLTLPFFLPEVVRLRLFETFFSHGQAGSQIVIGGMRVDPSASARIFTYQFVLQRILVHPFLGFGMTGFIFLDGQYFRNLIELGIIGSTAFFWLMFKAHRTINEAIVLSTKGRLHGLMIGFYAGFWGMLTHALSANSFIIIRMAEPFWCLMGMVIVYNSFHKELEAQTPPEQLAFGKLSGVPKLRNLPARVSPEYIKPSNQ
ncbi:MAG: hypothetical protein PHC61_17225 [Chitinivibrionales bacterium]|nr:hypothetical protein [Chitinivibrionales bacterium]